MPLTRDFKHTIQERAQKDLKFRRGLFEEAINEFLAGNIEVGKELLRDYINATIAFSTLAHKLHKSDKSLQRMLGPRGNPTVNNFFNILKIIQRKENIRLLTVVKPKAIGEN